MNPKERKATTIIKKIGFGFVVMLGGLFLLNGACALGERVAYGAFWGTDQPKGLYVHQKGERPRLKPGAQLNGWLYSIHINSLGFRGSELQPQKSRDDIRIWCVGGSTTFDIYAPDNAKTWPAKTAEILNQKKQLKRVEAINAGIPGEIIWGSMKDFNAHVNTVKPDYLVIYHGPNDMKQVASPPKQVQNAHLTTQKGEAGGIVQRLLSRTDIAIIRVLRRWLQPMEKIPETWQNNTLNDKALTDLRQRNMQLIRTARQRGVQPILATHALRAQSGDTGQTARKRVAESAQLLSMTPENVIVAFDQYNAMVTSLAKSENIPLADIRSAVGPETKNWGDATHFAEAGSKLAAETVANAILQATTRPRQ